MNGIVDGFIRGSTWGRVIGDRAITVSRTSDGKFLVLAFQLGQVELLREEIMADPPRTATEAASFIEGSR